MAEISPVRADSGTQSTTYTIDLLADEDFSILKLQGEVEKVAITVKTVATKVNVFATADFSASPVFSATEIEDTAGDGSPFKTVGETRICETSGIQKLKFVAVGGGATLSVVLKNE